MVVVVVVVLASVVVMVVVVLVEGAPEAEPELMKAMLILETEEASSEPVEALDWCRFCWALELEKVRVGPADEDEEEEEEGAQVGRSDMEGERWIVEKFGREKEEAVLS
ncbi:hypothetical protein B0O80DRAFT_445554 [Mortierella sp. GBAus27b]|nr:hypothetical protein B0O80DRAFT_445554 [Mortierella sp. GBAus27b]